MALHFRNILTFKTVIAVARPEYLPELRTYSVIVNYNDGTELNKIFYVKKSSKEGRELLDIALTHADAFEYYEEMCAKIK